MIVRNHYNIFERFDSLFFLTLIKVFNFQDEVTKKVDVAFKTNNEENIEQVFCRAKEKLNKKGHAGGPSQFMCSRLSQIQLVDGNEGTHLGIFEAQSIS